MTSVILDYIKTNGNNLNDIRRYIDTDDNNFKDI